MIFREGRGPNGQPKLCKAKHWISVRLRACVILWTFLNTATML